MAASQCAGGPSQESLRCVALRCVRWGAESSKQVGVHPQRASQWRRARPAVCFGCTSPSAICLPRQGARGNGQRADARPPAPPREADEASRRTTTGPRDRDGGLYLVPCFVGGACCFVGRQHQRLLSVCRLPAEWFAGRSRRGPTTARLRRGLLLVLGVRLTPSQALFIVTSTAPCCAKQATRRMLLRRLVGDGEAWSGQSLLCGRQAVKYALHGLTPCSVANPCLSCPYR